MMLFLCTFSIEMYNHIGHNCIIEKFVETIFRFSRALMKGLSPNLDILVVPLQKCNFF